MIVFKNKTESHVFSFFVALKLSLRVYYMTLKQAIIQNATVVLSCFLCMDVKNIFTDRPGFVTTFVFRHIFPFWKLLTMYCT